MTDREAELRLKLATLASAIRKRCHRGGGEFGEPACGDGRPW